MNLPNLEGINSIIFDFDGVFTNNKVYLNHNGDEFVQCSRGDGLGIKILNKFLKNNNLNIDIFVVSTEQNKVVKKRCEKLNLKCFNGIKNKKDFLKKYFQENNLDVTSSFKNMLYVGNDINDLEVILSAGFSVCPKDAHPLIKDSVSLIIDRKGGDDFVRTFIETIIDIKYEDKNKVISLLE